MYLKNDSEIISVMAKDTKTFILRIDTETMTALEGWASEEFRSTNGQLLWIINEALKRRVRDKKKGTEAASAR